MGFEASCEGLAPKLESTGGIVGCGVGEVGGAGFGDRYGGLHGLGG